MEMKERRSKGLCYNCDEKFTPGHKCRTQTLYLIEGQWPKSDIEEEPCNESDTKEDIEEPPAISLHGVTGGRAPQTMRVKVFVGRLPVTVLIDSGSTHNFISPRVANKIRF